MSFRGKASGFVALGKGKILKFIIFCWGRGIFFVFQKEKDTCRKNLNMNSHSFYIHWSVNLYIN